MQCHCSAYRLDDRSLPTIDHCGDGSPKRQRALPRLLAQPANLRETRLDEASGRNGLVRAGLFELRGPSGFFRRSTRRRLALSFVTVALRAPPRLAASL
jgi:hypothetical protein